MKGLGVGLELKDQGEVAAQPSPKRLAFDGALAQAVYAQEGLRFSLKSLPLLFRT
jgi:hypothetical protein